MSNVTKLYELPDIAVIDDAARIYLHDPVLGSRNITGADLKAAITASAGAVTGVNGQIGNVVLDAGDVGAEPTLGNPASDGLVLASTAAGVRSWTAAGGGGGGTPAASVVNETEHGLTPVVGVSTNYAREDHSHGTPTSPVHLLDNFDGATDYDKFVTAISTLPEGSTIQLGNRIYNINLTPALYPALDGISINGMGMPEINPDGTGLILGHGSIITGQLIMSSAMNSTFSNFGIDSGSAVVATYYAGVGCEGFGVANVPQTAVTTNTFKNVHCENISVILKSDAVAHAFLFECIDGGSVRNVKIKNGYHGFVIKATNSVFDNIDIDGMAFSGVYILDNAYAKCGNIGLSNIRVNSGAGVKINGYVTTIDGASIDYLKVLNATERGVMVEGLVSNIRVSNALVSGATYDGILAMVAGLTVTDSKVINNGTYGIHGYSGEIKVSGIEYSGNVAGDTGGTVTYLNVGADPAGTSAAHAALTATHGATGAVVGTTNTQELTNKTLNSNTNYIDADACHQIFFNNSGGVLAPGIPVVNTQWNAGNSATEVVKARANSGTTCPCHGLVETSVADGAIGSIRTHGILTGVDTSVWSEGADLWLSSTTAGQLTATMPTTVGQYQQFIGTVVRQHATLGVIAVNIGPALLIAAAGGGGSATITQVEVDFGATPATDKEFTITDASVSGTSKIVAVMAYEDTTLNTADEVAASGVFCLAGKPAAGSFTLLVASNTDTLSGTYKINYIVG